MTPMRRYLVETEANPAVERAMVALRAIRAQLAHAETVLLPGVGALADRTAVAVLRDALYAVEQASMMIGLDTTTRVARDLEWLVEAVAGATGTAGEEALVTLQRGIDVMTLLARDVEHQMAGAPPAALDGAIQMLREQVGRLLAGSVA